MTDKLQINEEFRKWHPNNCPVLEFTADGECVGTCTFYIGTKKICPRHGDLSEVLKRDKGEG